jgi:hypothetical protein
VSIAFFELLKLPLSGNINRASLQAERLEQARQRRPLRDRATPSPFFQSSQGSMSAFCYLSIPNIKLCVHERPPLSQIAFG